jgi:hypothetical protein
MIFSKLLQGVICPVLKSSGGKLSIFIDWGVMCSIPHRLGGKVDFFHILQYFLARNQVNTEQPLLGRKLFYFIFSLEQNR